MLKEREMDLPERWSAKRKSEIVLRLLQIAAKHPEVLLEAA